MEKTAQQIFHCALEYVSDMTYQLPKTQSVHCACSNRVESESKKRSLGYWLQIPNFSLRLLKKLHEIQAKPQREFCALLPIESLIANNCIRWRGIFKGLSQDDGLAKFAKNLHASVFNEDLLNDTSFIQVHLDGHYL
jgi:hypothetical protein